MSHPPKKRKNLYKLIFGFCQNFFLALGDFIKECFTGTLHYLSIKDKESTGPLPTSFQNKGSRTRISMVSLRAFIIFS